MIFFEKEQTPQVFSNARIDDNSSRLGHGEPGANIHGIDRALDRDSPVRLHDVSSSGTMGKRKVRRRYTWTCQFCGIDFETENLQQRYCKPSHKQRAYELRQEQRSEIPVDVTP